MTLLGERHYIIAHAQSQQPSSRSGGGGLRGPHLRIHACVPSDERVGLTAHARKTAIAIGPSIFEACGRLTNKGFIASLGVAHGEANEMLFQARVAQRLGFGDAKLGVEVRKKLAHLHRMIYKPIIEARNQSDFEKIDSPASGASAHQGAKRPPTSEQRERPPA